MCNCKEQLCWSCKKATGGCSWSKHFKPVEGWDAKPTVLNDRIKSFKIKSCPEYEADDITMTTLLGLAQLLNIRPHDLYNMGLKRLKSIARRQGVEIIFYFDEFENGYELGIKKINPPFEFLKTG